MARKKPANEGPALCARRSCYYTHQPCPRQNTDSSPTASFRYLLAQRCTGLRGVALQRPTPCLVVYGMTYARDPPSTIPHSNAAVKSHGTLVIDAPLRRNTAISLAVLPQQRLPLRNAIIGTEVRRLVHRRH